MAKSKTDPRIERIVNLISELFSDTSVSQETTKVKLQSIRDEIDVRLEALDA